MKILHVVHNYAPAVGGTQWMVQQLSERLVARYGDEVVVFTTVAYSNAYFWDRAQPAMKPGVERMNGVTLRRSQTPSTVWAGYASSLRGSGIYGDCRAKDRARGLYFGPIVPGLTAAIATSGADTASWPRPFRFCTCTTHWQAGMRDAGCPVGALHPADPWCFDRKMIYTAIKRCDAYVAYTEFERDFLGRRGMTLTRWW